MRKFFKRVTPNRETIHGMIGDGHLQRRFSSTLLHPKLWHLTRHTVAGGVAAGLFAGLIPGPLQMIVAALLAIFFRVNLPLALVVTLYTNPLTIVPLYIAGFTLGQWVTGNGGAPFIPPPDYEWSQPGASMQALSGWIASLGMPLAVGLPLLALLLATTGYVLIWSAWTVHIALYRSRRRRRASDKITREND